MKKQSIKKFICRNSYNYDYREVHIIGDNDVAVMWTLKPKEGTGSKCKPKDLKRGSNPYIAVIDIELEEDDEGFVTLNYEDYFVIGYSYKESINLANQLNETLKYMRRIEKKESNEN